jgi:hypothetical protein
MKSDESPHPHELISAFADRLATPEETARLQEHLKYCAGCRQFLHDLREIAAAVGGEALPPAPADLSDRIRAQIERTDATPRIVPFRRSPFPLAGAATVLLTATLWLLYRHPSPVAPGAGSTSTRISDPGSQISPSRSASSPPAMKPDPRASATSVPVPGPPPPRSTLQGKAPNGSGKGDTNKSTDSRLGALNSQDYLGTGEARKAANEAEPMASDAARAKPNPTLPSSQRRADAMLDKVLASGLTGENYEKAKSRQAALEPMGRKDATQSSRATGGAKAAAPDRNLDEPAAGPSQGARSLAYEGPGFSATFGEDGDITVIARGFACSVSASEQDRSPSTGAKNPVVVESLATLFSLASSREFLSMPPGRGSAGGSELPARPPVAASSLALRDAAGDPIHSIAFLEPLRDEDPQPLRNLRRGIQFLIQERYRQQLEARCGPLPAVLLASP